MASGPQSLESQTVKNSCPEWKEQELRPVVYQGHIVPDYGIGKDGIVISYKRTQEGKPLTWSAVGSVGNKYPAVKLAIPIENVYFQYTGTNEYRASTQTVGRKVKVHILVADSWLDDSCPKDLEPYWNMFSDELKAVLRPYFHIDHIDDNKYNAHISNLKFVSPRENQHIIKGITQQSENNT